MDQRILIVHFLWTGALAGLAGTAAMTLVMRAIARAAGANADMVRAIGSFLTRSVDNALLVGVSLYVVGGLVFAMLYALALAAVPVTGLWPTVVASALLGFAHGFAMSFVLVAAVAEHHPLEQFRDAGFGTALVHVAGHVAYGLGVGAVLGALGPSIG